MIHLTAKTRTVPGFAEGMRLNRYIARSGTAARRQCDQGIQEGMVTVNGTLVTSPAYRVRTGDLILWDGEAVTLPRPFLAAMNKPAGYETTMEADSRRSVAQLAGDMPRGAAPVGRLDLKTGGLLLWSNDGELIYRLSHPKWKVEREYMIVTGKPVVPDDLKRLRKGGFIEQGVYSKPLSVKQAGANRISVVLVSGRNREVRRLATVSRIPLIGLERIRFGGIVVSGIDRGAWRELTEEETRGLYRLVGLEAGH